MGFSPQRPNSLLQKQASPQQPNLHTVMCDSFHTNSSACLFRPVSFPETCISCLPVVGYANCKGQTACVERFSPQMELCAVYLAGWHGHKRSFLQESLCGYFLLLAVILKPRKMYQTWQTANKNMFRMENSSGLNPASSQGPAQLLAHPHHPQRDRGGGENRKKKKCQNLWVDIKTV